MIVQRQILQNALKTVKKSIPSGATTLEVLKCVNLCVDDDLLHVRGTDLETFTIATIGCMEAKDEDVCVSFSVFSAAVDALDDGEILLEASESTLTVFQGKTKLEFPVIPGAEFPITPIVEESKLRMSSDDLLLAFSRVIHAAATDESRPVLTGIYVSLAGEVLTTVCADGFRMAVSNLPVDTDKEFTSLIPARAVQVVLPALSDGDVEIFSNTNRLCFALPEKDGVLATVYCQLIEGHYVNYRQIIPDTYVASIFIEKETLVKALKLGNVFSKANADILRHTLTPDNLHLLAYSPEDGAFDKDIVVGFAGEPVEFALNLSYEVAALATMNGLIAIECLSPNRPVVFYQDGRKDDYLCVLMPMHIRK